MNPSVSEAEMNSLCSSERTYNFQKFNRKLSVGSIGEDIVIETVATNLAKAPTTVRRQATPKTLHPGPDRDLVSSQKTDGFRI